MKTIKQEFDRLTNNSGNFVFSSPSNGIETESAGYVSTDPNSEFFGDGKNYCIFLIQNAFKGLRIKGQGLGIRD